MGEWSVSRPGCAYPRGKDPRYPSDRRLGGPQSRSGHRGTRKNPLPGIEPRLPGHPDSSQDTIPAEMPQLLEALNKNVINGSCRWMLQVFLKQPIYRLWCWGLLVFLFCTNSKATFRWRATRMCFAQIVLYNLWKLQCILAPSKRGIFN
jgi:hypothetical protein